MTKVIMWVLIVLSGIRLLTEPLNFDAITIALLAGIVLIGKVSK